MKQKVKFPWKKLFFFHKVSLLALSSVCWIFQIAAEYKPKIYDCFPFFNELEILEIKLNELYDHVDYFVLVECTETFGGNPKLLYFAENKERFSKFLDKIIHVVVDEHVECSSFWDREIFQKNQILRGLTNCHDEDIVIIEDLDEIISASRLPEILDLLLTNQLNYVTCAQTMYSYFLNRCGSPYVGTNVGYDGDYWLGSVATKYADVKLKSPHGIRNERTRENAVIGGWHFTYMGGTSRVRRKIESFGIVQIDLETYKHPDNIRKDIEALPLVEIDENYPHFVRDNIPYFQKLGLIDQKTHLPQPYDKVHLLPFKPQEWYGQASIIEALLKKHKPKVVIEVGCQMGTSTRYMASLLQDGGILYAVDQWPESSPCPYEQFLSNVIHTRLTDKIVPIRMVSSEASKFLAHESPDFIYIDTDPECVYADLAAWYPLIKGRGIICGDNYLNSKGQMVKRAVDQFAADNGLTIHHRDSFWCYEAI